MLTLYTIGNNLLRLNKKTEKPLLNGFKNIILNQDINLPHRNH